MVATRSAAKAALSAARPEAEVLGNPDLAQAITSHVGSGDMLCWALGCRAFRAAQKLTRPGSGSRGSIVTPVVDFLTPARLRWMAGEAGFHHSVTPRFYQSAHRAESLATVKFILEGEGAALMESMIAPDGAHEPDPDHVFWGPETEVEAMVGMMKRHRSAWVQKRACHALANLARDSPANRACAAEAGAVEAVVAAMRAHGGDAGVQEWACRALASITCDNPASRARAAEAGAVEAVVAAMRAHGGSAGMQEGACDALASITCDSPANRARAVEAGAVEAVVAAMRAHGGAAGVQEWACHALASITCDNPANRARAAEAGAVEAVVAAMRAHGGAAGVQEFACGALANLAHDNPASRARAAEAGAVEAVVVAMRAHGGAAGVQEYGRLALANLARRG